MAPDPQDEKVRGHRRRRCRKRHAPLSPHLVPRRSVVALPPAHGGGVGDRDDEAIGPRVSRGAYTLGIAHYIGRGAQTGRQGPGQGSHGDGAVACRIESEHGQREGDHDNAGEGRGSEAFAREYGGHRHDEQYRHCAHDGIDQAEAADFVGAQQCRDGEQVHERRGHDPGSCRRGRQARPQQSRHDQDRAQHHLCRHHPGRIGAGLHRGIPAGVQQGAQQCGDDVGGVHRSVELPVIIARAAKTAARQQCVVRYDSGQLPTEAPVETLGIAAGHRIEHQQRLVRRAGLGFGRLQ